MDVKEKLVELIDSCSGCPDGMSPFDDSCGSCRYKESAMCNLECLADQLIANGVTVQEWISVKDRLPEDDLPQDTDRKQIRCLVATDKGTVKSCVRQRYQTMKNGQLCLSPWEWNKNLFAKPTHWMPLPEPPVH